VLLELNFVELFVLSHGFTESVNFLKRPSLWFSPLDFFENSDDFSIDFGNICVCHQLSGKFVDLWLRLGALELLSQHVVKQFSVKRSKLDDGSVKFIELCGRPPLAHSLRR